MKTQNFILTNQDREEVCNPHHIKDLELNIRFVIGVPQDRDVILDYYGNVAYSLKQVDRASKFTQIEYREYYFDQVERWLSNPFTILAVDTRDNSICGIISGLIESTRNQHKKLLQFEKDYGKKVSECEGPNYSTKLITTFFTEIQSFTSNFLPNDYIEFMRIVGLVVSPEYQGVGIASKLWSGLLKLALNAGIEHITATSTSVSSVQIATKFGMKSAFIYKYEDFLCDGIPAFGRELFDGSTELQLMIGNLKDMKSFIY